MKKLLVLAALLLFTPFSSAQEIAIDPDRLSELKDYVEKCRQRDIRNIRRLNIPGNQKRKLAKWYRSDDYVPVLNLENPKHIGVIGGDSVDGAVTSVNVFQVIDDEQFILKITKAGIPAQGPIAGTPDEIILIWVKNVPTKTFSDGERVNIKGTFLVEGNKTYTTSSGSNTIPIIQSVGSIQKLQPIEKAKE